MERCFMHIKERVLAITATLATTAGLTAAVVAAAPPAFASKLVSGSALCVDGRNVEGVFVHANSGGGGWGIMNVPGNTSSLVNWHYTIPNSGSYYLDVGCGGSTSNWATDNYSANYSGNTGALWCYDFTYEVPPSKQYRCV